MSVFWEIVAGTVGFVVATVFTLMVVAALSAYFHNTIMLIITYLKIKDNK